MSTINIANKLIQEYFVVLRDGDYGIKPVEGGDDPMKAKSKNQFGDRVRKIFKDTAPQIGDIKKGATSWKVRRVALQQNALCIAFDHGMKKKAKCPYFVNVLAKKTDVIKAIRNEEGECPFKVMIGKRACICWANLSNDGKSK